MAEEAPACRALLNEATARWPARSRLSDGILGDQAHMARKSDHNQGLAVDLTHDPSNGVNCDELSTYLARRAGAGVEVRVKYVIWNRRIWSVDRKNDGWRPYTGTNPHNHHMHVSIYAHRRNDISPWFTRAPEPQEDALTPSQEKKLDRVIDLLEALVAPRTATKADKDKTKISLGDVLTVVEKETK